MTRLELIRQIYHTIVDWEGELHWLRFHIDDREIVCKELEDYWLVYDNDTDVPIILIYDDPRCDWVYASEKDWLEQEVTKL